MWTYQQEMSYLSRLDDRRNHGKEMNAELDIGYSSGNFDAKVNC